MKDFAALSNTHFSGAPNTEKQRNTLSSTGNSRSDFSLLLSSLVSNREFQTKEKKQPLPNQSFGEQYKNKTKDLDNYLPFSFTPYSTYTPEPSYIPKQVQEEYKTTTNSYENTNPDEAYKLPQKAGIEEASNVNNNANNKEALKNENADTKAPELEKKASDKAVEDKQEKQEASKEYKQSSEIESPKKGKETDRKLEVTSKDQKLNRHAELMGKTNETHSTKAGKGFLDEIISASNKKTMEKEIAGEAKDKSQATKESSSIAQKKLSSIISEAIYTQKGNSAENTEKLLPVFSSDELKNLAGVLTKRQKKNLKEAGKKGDKHNGATEKLNGLVSNVSRETKLSEVKIFQETSNEKILKDQFMKSAIDSRPRSTANSEISNLLGKAGIPSQTSFSTVMESLDKLTSSVLSKQVEQIFRSARITLKDKANARFQVQLQPKELGRVGVQLSLTDGILSGRFLVDNAEVQKALSDYLAAAAEEIRKDGMELAGFSVDVRSGKGESGETDDPQKYTPTQNSGFTKDSSLESNSYLNGGLYG